MGKFKERSIHLKRGQRLTFTAEKKIGDENLVPVQYPRFHQEVKKGERIFLDDGNLSGVVKQVSGQRVDVEIQTGGVLSDHKGINLPDAKLTADPITAKDKAICNLGFRKAFI